MNMKQALAVMAFAALSSSASAYLFNFEMGVGQNGAEILSYNGVSFENDLGDPWIYAEGYLYNCSSYPDGTSWNAGEYWINDLVGAWANENTSYGKITVDAADATYFEVGYCAGSNFYLEAYDVNDVLIDVDSGGPNRRYIEGNPNGPGRLHVDAPSGTYISYVIVHDSGNYWVIDNVETDASGIFTSADEQPLSFLLEQNTPNPFNPTTTIRFSMDDVAPARLSVHDLRGAEVAVLWNGLAERGETAVQFDGSGLASGVYYYTLESQGHQQTQRMLLLK